MHCPRAPTLEPSNKQPSYKRIVFRSWCPVFALAWLSAPVLLLGFSFPARSRLVPVYVFVPLPVFFPLAVSVAFQLPAIGTSGQVSFIFGLVDKGTDPRTGSFRYPSTYIFSVHLFEPTLFFPFHFALVCCRFT